jgi:hypothetical protein
LEKVTLSPQGAERIPPHNLRELALSIYKANGHPEGFIVFSSSGEQQSTEPPVYYFLPIAALYSEVLLRTLSATDCPAPSGELTLIVGAENVKGLL